MLVFNEGVPRSGKSYDAMKEHVLVALAAGRMVYARLNGLDFQAIADYLGTQLDRVEALLVHVPTPSVRTTFVAERDEAGQWSIPHHLKDALFVIDEAHEFYVSSRSPIDPQVEQFFALCGQNGMDGVLMSQSFRRVHFSVRARVERKNVFQKLTAVGMKGKYLLKRFQTVEPDKFEVVDSTVHTYDLKIFPLYAGYADGAVNTAVYDAGGTTIWCRLRRIGLPLFIAVVIGIWFLWHFVHTGGRGLLRDQPHSDSLVSAAVASAPAAVARAAGVSRRSRSVNESGMSDEARYVFDLCSQARPRLAAVLQAPGRPVQGVIEWPQAQSHSDVSAGVLDRMTFDQIRDLGVDVQVHVYGVKLVWRDQAVIVTAWPLPDRDASSGTDHSEPHAAVASAVASADAGGASWKSSPMRENYVPPEIMSRPEYIPHTLQ